MISIISLCLQCLLTTLAQDSNGQLFTCDFESQDIKEQLRRQSNFVYYYLREGRHSKALICDSSDHSIIGKRAAIIGVDKESNKYEVRIESHSSPDPDYFLGERRLISSSCLDPIPYSTSDKKQKVSEI